MPDGNGTSGKSYAMFFLRASTAPLEALFFTYLCSTILGTYLGLTSPPLVISWVVLSLGLLLLLWPRDEQLFSATRSTCARYKTIFLELCALVYILFAALSLFARFQARSFRSNAMLVLLREQAITFIWKIDLIGCAAIVIPHLINYHDICDRIHRRVLWFGKQLYRFSGGLCDVVFHMLQEPDLERQSRFGGLGSAAKPDVTILNGKGQATSKRQERMIPRLVDGPDRLTMQGRFRYLRSLSMSPASYTIMHQELRSISAQLRWNVLRDRYVYHKPSMQDLFSLAASQARNGFIKAGKDAMNAIGPVLQPPPRSRRTSTKARSPSFSSVVSDLVRLNNALGSQDPRPFEQTQQLDISIASQRSPISTPVFQLPGTIKTICVKALPDTGSTQNVIDKSLIQSLFSSIPVHPVSEFTDKLLVASDGQPILCIGKIYLSWMFKDESEKYRRCFYIVENCSKGVIIDNCFLRQTETISKHRHRLELTKPSESNFPSSHILSENINEARQEECRRQLVLGRINTTDIFASLDTGCEANLMSIDYAKRLKLNILPLPTSEQYIKYADGRRGDMLGQVVVNWSFDDTPDKGSKVNFYILENCMHPVIFGQRFIFSEDPWFNHKAAVRDSEMETAMIGVVRLGKARRFFGFDGYKPDSQEEAKQRERRARKDRAVALLQTQLRARSGLQPQQQAQTQPSSSDRIRARHRLAFPSSRSVATYLPAGSSPSLTKANTLASSHEESVEIVPASCGAKLYTSSRVEIRENLSTTTLCSLYRALLHVLRHSNWELTYAANTTWSRSAYSNSSDQWLCKPFPGFWACKRGFILWRPSVPSTADDIRIRTLCIPTTKGSVLGYLTKIYWHLLCGRGSAIIPRQAHLKNLAANVFPCVDGCQECHEIILHWLSLLRKRTSLLGFLIHRRSASKAWRAETFWKSVEILTPFVALQTGPKHRVFTPRVILWMREAYPDGKPGYRVEDRSCRSIKAYEPSLKQATSDRFDRSKITISGTHSTAEYLSSYGWNMFTSIQLVMLMVLRSLRLCEPPLEEGKIRIRWRCRCGRRMYDDFIECQPGAARELEESLNHRPTAESNASNHQRSSTIPILSGVSIQRHPADVNISLQTPSRSYEPFLQRRSGTLAVINCYPECRWLLVCARGKGLSTILSQLDICSTASDKELFQKLRSSYLGLKNKWIRIFSLKRIQSIRFVQFELHTNDLVDIRKVPDMPPDTKRDEYIYQSCGVIPPVADNLMTHLFHHPEDANERSITCLRAPKKRKVKLSICPQQGTSVGWGIHLVEGWVVSRVWLLVLSLFLAGSLVFGVCWAALHHDLQSAFGVSAYMVTLCGLVAGTLQASLT